MEYKDYYGILGIEKNASKDDIKKAYRNLAKKYHPDANPGDKSAEDKFKDINEAYEVLSDDEKKNQYDNFGNQTHFQGGSDFDPSQYGFGRGNTRYSTTYTSSDGDFSDFFNMFFGGNGGVDFENIFHTSGQGNRRTYQNPVDGDDQEVPITIAIREGLLGSQKKISIRKDGEIKRLNLKIPQGIQAGEKIRLRGQGKPGYNGGKNGNLYFVVRFEESEYDLKGKDLYSQVKLLPWEAALGINKKINTIDGEINVKIPSKIQTGKKIKISGKGYSDKKGNRGDLFIVVNIKNPDNMSGEILELYEKMKNIYEKEA